MSIEAILSEIDAEITRLEQAKQLLAGVTVKRGPGLVVENALITTGG